ncbi:hypothetical protein [Blastopirellula marina]|uniref:Uncharacterized protein n=1 Tax=Blastopirellula marina TaxID=124 RepID=A0A2S8F2R8_9BACT|nr:hypothetical protein [Blastopirellula marina]PQO26468.1 hypothetical protein C5Y98_30485 [Blastopirellula marina]PTL40781.1 hypothetical protein C5Y97_30500 [Blastopirellula marina]
MFLNLQKWFGAVTLFGAMVITPSLVLGDHAPKPTEPPSKQRDFTFRDFKGPPIRPKSQTMPNPLGLKGTSQSAAKDAPKPSDPPSKWRKYIFEDIKAPKPRPKSYPSTMPTGLSVPHNPAAKDAPDPKDPPSKWRKYIFEDIKAPKPRPKQQVPTNNGLPPVVGGKQKVGFPIPGTLPSHKPGGPGYPTPRDIKRPPYTHPPRDIRGPKGPLN